MDILSVHYAWVMIIILLKTCASPWQVDKTHTYTHRHLSVTFSCLQGFILVPGLKPVDFGSEPTLTTKPLCLGCSASFTCPPGNTSTEHQEIWFSSCHFKQKILLPWPLAAESRSWPDFCSCSCSCGWLLSEETHSFLLPQLPLVCKIKWPTRDIALLSAFSLSWGTSQSLLLPKSLIYPVDVDLTESLCDYDPEMRAKSLQSCPTLCNPMDCSPPGSSFHGFSRQESWSGLPGPPPGHLPSPGIEPESLASPALVADSLPLAPPGKSDPGIIEQKLQSYQLKETKPLPFCKNFWDSGISFLIHLKISFLIAFFPGTFSLTPLGAREPVTATSDSQEHLGLFPLCTFPPHLAHKFSAEVSLQKPNIGAEINHLHLSTI